MLLKSISCRISPEQVIIKIIHIYALLLYLINKHLVKLKSLRHHAFLGREPGHLSKKLSAAFKRCGQKTACRYISQAYPKRISISKNRYNIVIGLRVKHVGLNHRTGSYSLDHSSLDKPDSLLRILYLLTYCDLVSFLHKLRNIGINRMVRYPCQRHLPMLPAA